MREGRPQRPAGGGDWRGVDALLATSGDGLVGLPAACGEGFAGVALATEAALQVGRQLVLERLEAEAEARAAVAPGGRGGGARGGPSSEEALAALARVRAVQYGESVELAPGLSATARASGACLGGAFWVLEWDGAELGVVMGFSAQEALGTPLDSARLGLLEAVAFGQASAPPPPAARTGVVEAPGVDGVVNAIVKAVSGGSCVLAPVRPSGHVFELLEVVSGYLAAYGLSRIPLFYVSPAARASLSYANTAAEWLAGARQQRAFAPEPPFGHDELLRQGRLRAGADFSQLAWAEPCVALVPSGSLSGGSGAHLLRRWGPKPGSLVVLTEEGGGGAGGGPTADEAAGLAAGLRVVRCRLSPGPSPEDYARLLGDLQAARVAVEENLWRQVRGLVAPGAGGGRYLPFSRKAGGPAAQFGDGRTTRLAPVGARLQEQLDAALAPVPGLPHTAACRLPVRVAWDGDAVELEGVPDGGSCRAGIGARTVWGQPRLQDLADALSARGFGQASVKRRRVPAAAGKDGAGETRGAEEEACLDLGGGRRITLGLNRTVVAAPDAAARQQLAEVLLEHLNRL